MDSRQIASQRLSWLRRTWLRLTIPPRQRCSRCPRRAEGWTVGTTEKRGTVTVTTTRHYCTPCFDLVTADWGAHEQS